MKEQGATVTPSEPGVDWQRVTSFPAQDLVRTFHQLQERALRLELENLELRGQQHGRNLSSAEFAEVYDAARVGYIETDTSAVIQRINRIGARLLGGEPNQLTSKPLTDYFAAGDADVLREQLQRCGRGETSMSEEFVLQPRGRDTIRVHAFCLPKAPNEKSVRIALADITRVAEIEQNLTRLSSFPAYNPNPVLEFSKEGKLIWFNEAALDLAKYLGLGSPLQIAPPHSDQIARQSFESREPRLREETVIGDRHIFWSFFPIEVANVIHCYGTDLTERLQVEQQLEQVRKLETVGHLASNVAHDFNNVLGIIQGYTCLLLAQSLPAETAEALKQIATAAERATYLTRQLMTFSRKQAFQPKDFDLNELVTKLSHTTRGLLGQSIHQELKLGSNLPRLHADAGMIEQIIMNMTMNARDAMPRGGQLTISTNLVEVGSEASRRNPDARPGKYICLTITDTGQGMDQETVSKIFEPFFTTKESGLGLGLSSVYGIVRQHQGWVEVQSTVGKGSVFKIFLPTLRVPYGAAKREPPAQVGRAGGAETILVVEDEPALRELVSRQLRRQGYLVIQASTGKEALALWGEHGSNIALLFTDMVMPDAMTGSELAETLQAQKPDLKVIFTSGYSLEVLQQDFALRGDVHFLQKPYHQDALIKSVRAALDAKAPVNT